MVTTVRGGSTVIGWDGCMVRVSPCGENMAIHAHTHTFFLAYSLS